MMDTYSFGEWVKRRRKELRLTQREVAAAAYCSTAMIKKIEADERQPSPELANSLADVLQVSSEQRSIFVEAARGQRPVDHLRQPDTVPATADAPMPPDLSAVTLPKPATPFIGRAQELARLTDQLRRDDVRLATVIGPGGMGKTRLAIEAARAVQGDFNDGAAFVPLSTVVDPDHMPQAIAQSLRLPYAGSDPPWIQIQRLLRRRHLLLVLDNFEQLVNSAALLSDLLAAARSLHLLVTSRERLNLAGEWLFPVPPLDKAVALFGQTAARAKPDFHLEDEEAAVADICQLVGGHPLAVELAASWTRLMPTAQIAAQIQGDLDFLGGGPRSAPERHRSLRALFDHSWRLLSPEEQKALARLSVFSGGFAQEQAEEVAGATWPILLGLVDKSLVETRGDNRFDLHELTRQYAAAKLADSGAAETVRQAHFAAYREQAARFIERNDPRQGIANLARSEAEQDNTRAALAWGLENGQTEAVLEIIHHKYWMWLVNGYWREGERWAAAAVAQAGDHDSSYLCLVLNHLATFSALQGRFQDSFPLAARALGMARRLEEPWPMAFTLFLQGQAQSDKAASLAAYEEAIAICRQHAGEPRFDGFLPTVLRLKAERLAGFGMIPEARACYEESLSRMRAMGNVLEIPYPLGNLGRLALYDGDLVEAHRLIDESVSLARQGGHQIAIADWAYRLGQVHLYLGDLEAAEANLQETLNRYEDVGNQFGPPGVLSNLALVAVEKGDLNTAAARIQDSFRRYRTLDKAIREISASADYFRFGDTLESVLHAGLVAHAQGNWGKALTFFEFFAYNVQEYKVLPPLLEKVSAARTTIEDNLDPAAYETAVTEGRRLTLYELLDAWPG